MVQVTGHTRLVHCKSLHGRLHPVVSGALPNKVKAEAVRHINWHVRVAAKLQSNLLTAGELDNLPNAGPRRAAIVSQPQLVTSHQTEFVVFFREHEIGNTLLVETNIPVNCQIILGLRLLHFLVIISFELNKWPKDILVLVRVLVSGHDGLWLLIEAWFFEILESGAGILLPQLLQLVDLRGRNLACASLLLLRWHLHKPGEEAFVGIDQRQPLRQVPVHILETVGVQARLAAEQNHHRLRLGRNETKEKGVATTTVVALKNGLAQRTIGVKRNFLVL
mmetsp:Transcript_18544/g.43512  ORF Transcript_18544/g.43512 Transcript_18544/m.43512 type:complete len:278 (+) Transcript_18544:2345-3178(+)